MIREGNQENRKHPNPKSTVTMNISLRFTGQIATGCHPAGESEVILNLKPGSNHTGIDKTEIDMRSRYSHLSEIVEKTQFGIDEKLLEILSPGLSKVIVPKST